MKLCWETEYKCVLSDLLRLQLTLSDKNQPQKRLIEFHCIGSRGLGLILVQVFIDNLELILVQYKFGMSAVSNTICSFSYKLNFFAASL